MRRTVAAGSVLVCLWGEAVAGVQPEITASTTFVSGTMSPPATVDTLGAPVAFRGTYNPALRLGASGGATLELGARSRASARWGVYRDQALCDTCNDGSGIGWTGGELVGSTDLDLRASTDLPLRGEALVRVGVLAVLPASRDALSCNPFYGSPGVSAAFVLPAAGSTVTVGTSAQRPFYRYEAVPVGRCAPQLRGDATVDGLAGPIAPTPWDGQRFASQNPALLLTGTVAWTDPHALLPGITDHLSTGLSIGLDAQRDRPSPAVAIDTLTGPVVVAASREPVSVGVPWSLSAGWELTERSGLSLSLSNRLPSVLTDPGGTIRVLPATTAVTLAFTARP